MAAGKGTRMKSTLPKVLHTVSGKPMLEHVINSVSNFQPDNIFVIIGHGAEQVKEYFSENQKLTWVEQKEQLGTGHAIMQVFPHLINYNGDVLILSGDVPLLSKETIEEIFNVHQNESSQATILTTIIDNPFGYGRIIKDENNNVTKIVEEKDCNKEEKLVKEINSGTYCFNWNYLNSFLKQITPKNAQGEYYLTDVIKLFVENNLNVKSYITTKIEEITGINDRYTLSEVEQLMKKNKLREIMLSGVTIKSPDTTYIESDVTIGSDSVIYPNTTLEGKVVIGANCTIGPNAYIKDSKIGANSNLAFCVIKNADLKDDYLSTPFSEMTNERNFL